MSERQKGRLLASLLFAVATCLSVVVGWGRSTVGNLSLVETKQLCIAISFTCLLGGAIALIGNHRLNQWINPRLERLALKSARAKKRREELRFERGREEPERAQRSERRKHHLLLALAWALFLSPILMVAASILLAVCYNLKMGCSFILISLYYGFHIWKLVFTKD